MSRLLHEIIVDIDLTNNNDGQGKAWYRTAAIRKAIEKKLRSSNHIRQPFNQPVCIRLVRILGPKQRLWDADSILRGSAKQLIDSLVAVGWFHDDKPQWIKQVVGDQEVDRQVGPAVKVQVYDLPATFDSVCKTRKVQDKP
jgi:hypothetical protein